MKTKTFLKLDIPRLRAEHVGDAFAPWVEDLFTWVPFHWHCRMPSMAGERASLRRLLERALGWERDFRSGG